ncbi:hypothetical protein [Aeromicrobium sp.]|nr:hypothetical protein [Aeromicrobium sp.]MBC7630748.1 hypothetical protein [Aeromicrobium sp.]
MRFIGTTKVGVAVYLVDGVEPLAVSALVVRHGDWNMEQEAVALLREMF